MVDPWVALFYCPLLEANSKELNMSKLKHYLKRTLVVLGVAYLSWIVIVMLAQPFIIEASK